MPEPFLLLQGDLTCRGDVQPQVPTNTADVVERSDSSSPPPFWLGLLGGAAAMAIQRVAPGLSNSGGQNLAPELTFGPAGPHAQVELLMEVAALQRSDGLVDIGLKTSATFTPAYSDDGNPDVRSLFQDQVSFRIWPADPSLVNINPLGVAPQTDEGQVAYNDSVTWTVGGGFEVNASGPSANIRADYSTQVSASSVANDFGLEKSSDTVTGALQWVASMRNLYSGNQPDTQGYDPDNPLSIVDNGAFTKSLKDPPPIAKADLDLVFHAAYTSIPPDFASRQISFQFETRQRLMYDQVVGSTALAIPYWVICQGSLTLDLSAHTLRYDGGQTTGYNCMARLPA